MASGLRAYHVKKLSVFANLLLAVPDMKTWRNLDELQEFFESACAEL
jgi:hypothetical protein